MPLTLPLMAHQLTALEKSAGQEAFAYLMDYGTGKSLTTIADILRLFMAGEVRRVLVLAPKGCYAAWSLESEEESHWWDGVDPFTIGDMRVVRWRGGHTVREKAAIAEALVHPGLSVLVMNCEALSVQGRAAALVRDFLQSGPSYMVVDESTWARTPSARRTKVTLNLANLADHRRILTGLPTPRSTLDLYTQFRVLDWRILGQRSYYSYRARYAVLATQWAGSRSFKVVTGYQNTQELFARIEPHSVRVAADDCLDLPERTYQRRLVEFTPEQRRLYTAMQEEATARLSETEFVSATLVITQMLRLHQIACGFVTTETGEEVAVPSRRLDALVELLQECGERKTVIWSHWRPAITQITARLRQEWGRDSVVEYHGGVSDTDRATARERFATDPSCLFLVGNQSVGGRGLNELVVARHAVFYSNSHDLEHRLNSEARTRRKGSEIHSSVVYTDLCCEESGVETRIIRALRERIDIAAQVTGDNFREWLV